MSPLALHFLRRVAVAAVLGAVALLAWSRGAAELGLDAAERVARAEGAVEVARAYGAADGVPVFHEAEEQLAAAHALLQQGRRREAGRTAALAEARAQEAQREVIVQREAVRARSEEIVEEIDRELIALEELYEDTVKTLPRSRASELLTRMKQTRAAGASLILAHEQGDYRKVVKEHAEARTVLAESRRMFEAAGSAGAP